MGQKLLVLLDSDMTCDVKRLFFCCDSGQSFCRQYVAVKRLQEGFESGGQWVRSHTRTLVNVILTLQPT